MKLFLCEGERKGRRIRLPPTRHVLSVELMSFSSKASKHTGVTMGVCVCKEMTERVCVCVCHLCMNYNKALTEGEVGPSSSWLDESVVSMCVCLCTAGVKE